MTQEPHPKQAPQQIPKEPSEIAIFNFDFAGSEQIDAATTISSVSASPPAAVTPNEEHRTNTVGAITGGPFRAGETLTASGGATCKVLGETADGAALVAYYIDKADTIGSGETLTGATSKATAVTSAVHIKVADGLLINNTSISGQKLQANLTDGLRPLQGEPFRQYLLTIYAVMSDGQKLPCLGRVNIFEETKANNPA